MQDEKTARPGNGYRINVEEAWEVSDWAASLNTTPAVIKEAVATVGAESGPVAEYVLRRKRLFHPWSPTAAPKASR